MIITTEEKGFIKKVFGTVLKNYETDDDTKKGIYAFIDRAAADVSKVCPICGEPVKTLYRYDGADLSPRCAECLIEHAGPGWTVELVKA